MKLDTGVVRTCLGRDGLTEGPGETEQNVNGEVLDLWC